MLHVVDPAEQEPRFKILDACYFLQCVGLLLHQLRCEQISLAELIGARHIELCVECGDQWRLVTAIF